MDDLQLLIDLHKRAKRQGPGGDLEIQKMIDLAMLDQSSQLKIADIGCGTGTSALKLAHTLNASCVTAIDFLPGFIEVLQDRIQQEGLAGKVEPRVCSMDDLPFKNDNFDLIWSEGAIYNIGFSKGINYWKRFLKPGGLLVVSEITWTTNSRPKEIESHWVQEYSEISTASEKINILEQGGYSPVAYFTLPEHCWINNYYRPMRSSFSDFLSRNDNSSEAKAIVAAEEKEIDLYERFKDYYSYGVYIARKLSE
jgi:ubiquinone/menaquinone biosynthesis C-methylase UbiE